MRPAVSPTTTKALPVIAIVSIVFCWSEYYHLPIPALGAWLYGFLVGSVEVILSFFPLIL
jgi:hypothetical protein